ncbi:MAG: GntR family transcriptional regulator [Pseudomonadota bacterium]|nr:GntR family transcriptional regulator [Pseudomonadota bacterium]
MHLPLDPANGVPLYLQLADGIRGVVASGALVEGGEAPSLRTLAAELRVNYHTVARAYHELEADGTIVRQRGGAYVVGAVGDLGWRLIRQDVEALWRRAEALSVGEDALVALVRSTARERQCG